MASGLGNSQLLCVCIAIISWLLVVMLYQHCGEELCTCMYHCIPVNISIALFVNALYILHAGHSNNYVVHVMVKELAITHLAGLTCFNVCTMMMQ